jgi:outer membrane protein TolC
MMSNRLNVGSRVFHGFILGEIAPRRNTAPATLRKNYCGSSTYLRPAVVCMCALAVFCTASVAQQASPEMPKAQQVTPSARTQGSGVQVQQSSNSTGSSATTNTVNSSIQVSAPYQGSIRDPNASSGPLMLNIADAIQRGLRFNLGTVSANSSVRQLRGERLAALSQMLPNIYGTLSETGSKLDLQAEGINGAVLGPSVPTTVGPFHFYSAFANLSENLSITSLHNWRGSKAAENAAQMSAKDAREIIILAVSGTYLQILASRANVLSQESQVKQAEATFQQSQREYQAGTKPVIDRNRSFVQFHTEQQRLTSLRADLVKQFMQLARLIGLPVTQVLTLGEELPAEVPQAVPVEEAVKLATENRSDLKAARMQLKAAQEAHKASKAEYLPSVGISGYYGLQGINPDKGVSVFQAAGTINIPIFQSGRVKADIEQADAAVSQRQAEYDDEKGAIELDVRQSYVDLQVAKEQIEVAAENRKIAAETLTESLDRFAAGVTNSVEVVQSQETVASAERDYVSSLFTLNLARIRLARAIGLAEQFIPNMLKGN